MKEARWDGVMHLSEFMKNIIIFIKKIIRRINMLMPSFLRRQCAVLLTYDNRFFESPCYRYFTDSQVDEFCNAMIEFLHPKTAIDIGCGLAHYLVSLKAKGVYGVGFDVSQYAVQNANSGVPVYSIDLKKPFRSNQKFDIAICFEVAEHLPKYCAPALVESLCTLSDLIMFTAAPPGQPGIDHINLQPNSFWVNLFSCNQFVFDENLTKHFTDRLVCIGAPEWFCRNFSIFSKKHIL